jgi:hypothetical protein
MAQFKVLSWYVPGVAEENHDKPYSGHLVSRLIFVPGTHQIQSTRASHLIMTFSVRLLAVGRLF